MRADATIFGREPELKAIADLLAGPPAGVIIEGEPGIGKTTVWEAGVDAARERGVRVLACRAAGTEVQLSFAGLGDLLEPALADVLDGLPPPRRRALEVALLLEDPAGAPPDRRAVGLAVLGAFEALGAAGPVLVAVDDAHWLDDETAHALAFALRRLEDAPVAVLAAVRAGQGEAFLAPDRRTRLRLAPLDVAAIRRLLRDRLGLALPRPLLMRLHETSGGNPFYALELGRAVQDRGGLAAGERLPLSESLQALVAARLDELPGEAREPLLAAALLAEPTVAAVGGHLDAAVTAEVVRIDGERVAFANPLLAAIVEERATPEERRRMHGRLAAVAGDAESRARHRALGVDGPDAEVATELDAAAQTALLRGAPEAAGELLELAARLTPRTDLGDRRRRLLEAADAYVTLGALAQATALLEDLLAELPAGDERAGILLRLGAIADDLERSQSLLERARREAAGDALLAKIHLSLASGWPLHGIGHALSHGRTALRHAEASGEAGVVVEVLARLALWTLWSGRSPAAPLERALTLERETWGDLSYDSPVFTLGLWQLAQGHLDDARSAFDGLAVKAAEIGDEVDLLALHGQLADVELRAGRWADALAHADAAYELAEQIGLGVDGGFGVYWKALAEAHAGHADEARSAAAVGAEVALETNKENSRVMSLGALGFLDLSLGDERRALENLRPLLEWLLPRELGVATHPIAPYALEALVGAGELDEATALIDRFRDEARRIDSPWALALGARLRGMALAAAGDLDGAEAALEESGRLHRSADWPFERARTLLELGRLRRRRKQKAAARETLEAALAIFDELPAPLWAGRAGAELDRVGLRRAAADELTETERRIAQLAAAGLKNREVAARLFVSPKTVEANLARAYRKLGIHSRAELGARLSAEQE